jgi:selenocysteine lyase/cysteine desulfurase
MLHAMSNEHDPLGVRADFRGASNGTYLDTPGTVVLARQVEEAGNAFLRTQGDGPISLPAIFQRTSEVRAKFASVFGAAEHEVGFMYTTAEGENVLTRQLDLKPGDNVVVDDLHYTTAYVLYRQLEQTTGAELRVVPSINGRAGVEEFAPHVDAKTKLVSVAWVSNVNGYRHDLKALADLAHANGALLYADAVQALGAFPVNLRDEGVDMISSGTYKWLLGGFGIAPFYLREEHHDRIRPDRVGAFSVKETRPGYDYTLHENARGFEYATLAFAPLYMLGAGLEILERVGLSAIEAHTVPLAHEMRRCVADLGFEVMTPEGIRSPIVAFKPQRDIEAARDVFKRHNVHLTLRVNAMHGLHVRAGAALFNNRDDVAAFQGAVEELASLPRV